MRHKFIRSFYKDADPCSTVKTVKAILSDIGIHAKSEEYQRSRDCYSCRLRLCSDNLYEYDIGVNGKGMTRSLSQASAYAELMERLQNKTLFREGLRYAVERNGFNGGLRFQYFPDEVVKSISRKKLESLLRTYFPRTIDGVLDTNGEIENLIFTPFKEFGSQRRYLLPIEIIRYNCSSTGMCAGNTLEEALCQGINEIFERYVLQRIFMGEECLPEIDLEDFRGTKIYRALKYESREKGLEIRVKDCSLGGRFPVLGLLIVDEAHGRYTFRLGADYNIITALERCYTEIFQGDNAERFVFSSYEPEYKVTSADYYNCRKNGTGHWPQYLLDIKQSVSKFPHADFTTSAKCFRHSIKHIGTMGYKVFYRDNSFLGFPAFHVFIPGLSETDAKFENVELLLKRRAAAASAIPLLQRIPSLSPTESSCLVRQLKNSGKCINLFRWISPRIGRKFASLVCAGLSVRLREYRDASESLKELISQLQAGGGDAPLYYKALYAFLCMKASCENVKMEVSRAIQIYGKKLFNEVEQDVADDKRSFLNSYPNCFDCNNCAMVNDCAYKRVVELESRLQSLQERRGR